MCSCDEFAVAVVNPLLRFSSVLVHLILMIRLTTIISVRRGRGIRWLNQYHSPERQIAATIYGLANRISKNELKLHC
jgi:hypothetical protein